MIQFIFNYSALFFKSNNLRRNELKQNVVFFYYIVSDIDQDCTEFAGVTYLGSAKINAPKSENEILRNINEMNSHSQSNGMKVSVSIPSCSEGYVV